MDASQYASPVVDTAEHAFHLNLITRESKNLRAAQAALRGELDSITEGYEAYGPRFTDVIIRSAKVDALVEAAAPWATGRQIGTAKAADIYWTAAA